MRATIALTVTVAVLAGCQLSDENPNWAPKQDYPSWAYDAPFYYKPSEDLSVSESVGEGIPVYYSDNRSFFVRHASGSTLTGAPRMALWYSDDSGRLWQRAGYFGVEQTHFLFQADKDGQFWVRFVGPERDIVQAPPGQPHRIYVVDTAGPQIELFVDPPPYEEDEHGNRVSHIYAVGETVIVRWRVRDANLEKDSIRLATTFASFPDNVTWSRFPVELLPVGTIRAPIPPEAAGPEQRTGGLRFRMEARDKAGNLTFAFTDVLRVAGGGRPVEPVTTRPTTPWEQIVQEQGTPSKKRGWPDLGSIIRGGTSRTLAWLPDDVAKHENVVLEFSANNGRSWRTVAENLQVDKSVKWTVPQVNSKLCRLRVLAIEGPMEKIMLAQTQFFTVHTLPPATIMGPKKVSPKAPENNSQ